MEEYYGGKPIEDYSNKKILAPMGTLPFRLLALEEGADIVYSEELIGLKLQKTVRVYNAKNDTIDFVLKNKDGSIIPKSWVFRTNKYDHPNVLQLGVSDAVTALNAATVVSRDVNGIDLNMGCPKHFSVSGGMGASLLKKPEIVKDILCTLKRNLPYNSITCKIRLLESVEATVDLLKIIESCGVSAVAIHARHVPDRPRDPANWEKAKSVIDVCGLNIPIIINGDVMRYEDISRVKESTHANSVMIARGALFNPSIFNPVCKPIDDVIVNYLKKCIHLDNYHGNSKYVLQQILTLQETKHKNDLLVQAAKSYTDIYTPWNLQDYYQNYLNSQQQQQQQQEQQILTTSNINTNTLLHTNKKQKLNICNEIDSQQQQQYCDDNKPENT